MEKNRPGASRVIEAARYEAEQRAQQQSDEEAAENASLYKALYLPYREGMSVTFDMPKEIEAQFAAEAQARGVPLSDYVRDFVVEHYREDADDLRTAQERLADPQPGLKSSQLRKNLGLDS